MTWVKVQTVQAFNKYYITVQIIVYRRLGESSFLQNSVIKSRFQFCSCWLTSIIIVYASNSCFFPIRDEVGTQSRLLRTAEFEITLVTRFIILVTKLLALQIEISHTTSTDTKKIRCLQLQLKVVSNLHLVSQLYFNHNYLFLIIYPFED